MSWLISASLFYYGWWNPSYLGLILGSILFNYIISLLLNKKSIKFCSIYILSFGIAINLGCLSYFKYTHFFMDNISYLFSISFDRDEIFLPLAISFFTFQQIAYLVDSWKGNIVDYNFLNYLLFITFFPQLIAGPIVHHQEMLPQFSKKNSYNLNYDNLAIGLSIFIIGLFKKVVIADTFSTYATPYFYIAEHGGNLTFIESWVAALSYTFQLYFDFSGYSDMAIGLAKIFGILLPINFNSPYKASSIIDFWGRWHITLSRFLRDYVYFPLGGSRKGLIRSYINLMITMLLGGLWHGAGWTFVIWGGLNGIYLVINHSWRRLKIRLQLTSKYPIMNHFSWLITFVSVVVAWVVFRASTIDAAHHIIKTMFGLNGFSFSFSQPVSIEKLLLFLICSMLIVKMLPNSVDMMIAFKPTLEENYIKHKSLITICWKPTVIWGLLFSVFFLSSLYIMTTSGYHEFIYRFF